MQCAHKLRQPSKYWFYPNCTRVFLDFSEKERERKRREKERLKWNCHDPSVQCFIHFTSACCLFFNSIELANRSLLDNWKTCHFVIWHTLYENHSHTFLMQWQIKEVLGAVTQLALSAFCVHIQSCVYMNIMHFPLLLQCLGAAVFFIPSNNNFTSSFLILDKIALLFSHSFPAPSLCRQQQCGSHCL